MKTTIKATTLLLALLVFALHTVEAKDAISLPESAASAGGTGFSLDVGNPDYTDSITVECNSYDFSKCSNGGALISTTSSYTIVSYGGLQQETQQGDMYCNDQNIPFGIGAEFAIQSSLIPYSFTNKTQIHCTGDLIIEAPLDYLFVQYVPYDTRVVQLNSMPLEDTHFIIIAGVVLALASMWLVISLFKKRI